jgi:hypothetical protein
MWSTGQDGPHHTPNEVDELPLISWLEAEAQRPTRSSGLSPGDFLFWGFVKDNISVSLLLTTLEEVKIGITEARGAIVYLILQNLWREFECGFDIVRITARTLNFIGFP